MTTPVGAAASAKYGFGLQRDTLAARTVIRHDGAINGFISDNAWFPAEQTSITVLTNSGSARTKRLLDQVARATFGVPLLRIPSRVTLSAAERAQYVGVYVMRRGESTAEFTIAEQNGQLYAQFGRQLPNPIVPFGNHVFGANFDPDVRLTFTVEHGKATTLKLLQNGQITEGTRKP